MSLWKSMAYFSIRVLHVNCKPVTSLLSLSMSNTKRKRCHRARQVRVWLRQPTGGRGRSADPCHTISIIYFRNYPHPGGDFGSQTAGVPTADYRKPFPWREKNGNWALKKGRWGTAFIHAVRGSSRGYSTCLMNFTASLK